MTEAAALSSSPAVAPKAPTKQPVNAAENGARDSFATVLDKATNAESQTTQASQSTRNATARNTTTTDAVATSQGATIAAQTAVVTVEPVEGEAEAVDTPEVDPTAILVGATTQTAVQPAVGGLGLPAPGIITEAEGSIPAPDGTLVVPQSALGVTGTSAAGSATQGAAAKMGATAPAAMPPTAPATQPEAAASLPPEAETPGAETVSTQSPADGQPTSKASASTTQASPASASTVNTQANVAKAPGQQVEIAVDPAAPNSQKAAVDAVAAATTSTNETARTSATPTPTQAAAPAVTVQVYTRIIERFEGRAQRFEVRLDPAELGRVDVRIEVGADKKVHAVLAAHDSAALGDLMRGHRALERALSDAGFDLADGGVKFELATDSRQNASTRDGDARSPAAPNVWRSFNSIDLPAEAASSQVAAPWRHTRLDLVA